jgi:hypothetical protein
MPLPILPNVLVLVMLLLPSQTRLDPPPHRRPFPLGRQQLVAHRADQFGARVTRQTLDPGIGVENAPLAIRDDHPFTQALENRPVKLLALAQPLPKITAPREQHRRIGFDILRARHDHANVTHTHANVNTTALQTNA